MVLIAIFLVLLVVFTKLQNHNETIIILTNEENLEFDIIEKGKNAYSKVKTFRFDNIETDRLRLQKFFGKFREYPNLIIDISGNSGGSEKYLQ